MSLRNTTSSEDRDIRLMLELYEDASNIEVILERLDNVIEKKNERIDELLEQISDLKMEREKGSE